MSLRLDKLHAAHVEWLGIRKTLKGQEHRYFWRWLFAQRPEVVKRADADPVLLQKQCREIQRGSRPPPHAGLSASMLKRHAEELTRRYLSLAPEARPTFSDFLQRVLDACPTEQVLRHFLDTPGKPSENGST